MSIISRSIRSATFISYVVFIVILLFIPYVLPLHHLILLSYGIVFAIAALGFNLLATYTGLLSFGHAAFFATGAYTVAMLAKYLPYYYKLEIIIPTALASTLFLAIVFGLICVRHLRLFFAIITLALSMLIYVPLLKFYNITGGSDGLPVPLPNTSTNRLTFLTTQYWYFLVVSLALSLLLMRLIVSSPFGLALQVIRDNESRAELIGIPVRRYRFYAFLISAVFTGYAGALWSILNGHVTPEIADWLFSGELVYMTLLGGLESFSGPVIGAIIFTYIKLYALGYTEYWMLLMGGTIVVLALLLPRGIAGGIKKIEELIIKLYLKVI